MRLQNSKLWHNQNCHIQEWPKSWLHSKGLVTHTQGTMNVMMTACYVFGLWLRRWAWHLKPERKRKADDTMVGISRFVEDLPFTSMLPQACCTTVTITFYQVSVFSHNIHDKSIHHQATSHNHMGSFERMKYLNVWRNKSKMCLLF